MALLFGLTSQNIYYSGFLFVVSLTVRLNTHQGAEDALWVNPVLLEKLRHVVFGTVVFRHACLCR